jgi:HSP20 family protein
MHINVLRCSWGEKEGEKQEKEKDCYLRERSFEVPDGVDIDKIEASFTKGILT